MRTWLANRGIRFHLVLSIGGLACAIATTLLLAGAGAANRRSEESLRARVAAIASAVAAVDWDQCESIRTSRDTKLPGYQEIRLRLGRVVHSDDGLRRAFILRARPNHNWMIVALVDRAGADAGPFGEEFRMAPDVAVVPGAGGVLVDRRPRHDEDGDWIAAYAPIRDRRGRTVAQLGVEVSAAELLQHCQEVAQHTALSLGLVLLCSFLLAEVLAGAFCRPIQKLLRGTQAVAAGDLSVEVAIGTARELALLGRSFNTMTRALQEHHARLLELSETDFLTGLRNHRYLQDRLAQEVSRAQRHRHPVSLVMFDLDHFREVNNTYGHRAGDDVLQQFAQLLHRQVRDSDIVTRYGGEEFAVILPETTAAQAFEMAERVRHATQEHLFEVRAFTATRSVELTVSGGVAECPADSQERDGLVMAADVALLHAKALSRDRVCLFAEKPRAGKAFDLAKVHSTLQSANLAAVELLAEALDARDRYTRGHSENVTALAVVTAGVLGLPVDEVRRLRLAALLHDVGKIGIPDSVLHKCGSLTPQEWALVRTHCVAGAAILSKAPLLGDLVPVVLAHHERYDGSGYPGGLAGEAIPLGARILAVVDAYDAMISDRPYRPALSAEQALQELRAGAGTQFDPDIVSALEQALSQLPPDARTSVVADASAWVIPEP